MSFMYAPARHDPVVEKTVSASHVIRQRSFGV
jgi:hypothetical protein